MKVTCFFGIPKPAFGEVWVAAGTLAIAAAGTAYTASQQKKAQQKQLALQEQGMNVANSGSGSFKLRPAPGFVSTDFDQLQKKAIEEDRAAYQRSDADFATRHRGTVKAEKLFEQSVLDDQSGDSELLPAVQNEFQRAGLAGALSAFGSTPGTLAPGSAGEASVARNLGLSVLGFQDRNRQNRQNSLKLAEELFQRRQFGLSGSDSANIQTQTDNAENAYQQGIYANQVGADLRNAGIHSEQQNAALTASNANAAANAQAKAATAQAIGSAATSAVNLYGQYKGGQTSYGTPAVSGTGLSGTYGIAAPKTAATPSYQSAMSAFRVAA